MAAINAHTSMWTPCVERRTWFEMGDQLVVLLLSLLATNEYRDALNIIFRMIDDVILGELTLVQITAFKMLMVRLDRLNEAASTFAGHLKNGKVVPLSFGMVSSFYHVR